MILNTCPRKHDPRAHFFFQMCFRPSAQTAFCLAKGPGAALTSCATASRGGVQSLPRTFLAGEREGSVRMRVVLSCKTSD